MTEGIITRRGEAIPFVAAIGGDVQDIEIAGIQYRVHTFTSSGTFEVVRRGEVDVLVVAGGGSGGTFDNDNGGGGGGGAGGLIERIGMFVFPGSYSVIVGQGGAPQPAGAASGFNGENSSIFDLVAIGGGAGGGRSADAASGGSGGGANQFVPNIGADGVQPIQSGDSGTFGFGNKGGNNPATRSGAGGGGAGGPGIDNKRIQESDRDTASEGGVGRKVSALFGENVGDSGYFAGGGGGGARGGSGEGIGGIGGGGNGGHSGLSASDGMPNTGGGGGGASGARRPSGAGGSGIVILRYKIR